MEKVPCICSGRKDTSIQKWSIRKINHILQISVPMVFMVAFIKELKVHSFSRLCYKNDSFTIPLGIISAIILILYFNPFSQWDVSSHLDTDYKSEMKCGVVMIKFYCQKGRSSNFIFSLLSLNNCPIFYFTVAM